MTTPTADVVYRIDAEDRLVFFNARWDGFAAENEGAGLSAECLHGRSLWSYITGAEVRHFHRILLVRVRGRQQSLTLPFRCDAPDERRYMGMRMRPLSEGWVEYRCTLLRREPRPARVVDHGGPQGPLVRMCSWCNRVDVGNDSWRELEEAIGLLDLFGDAPPPITHTMCDDCLGEDGEEV